MAETHSETGRTPYVFADRRSAATHLYFDREALLNTAKSTNSAIRHCFYSPTTRARRTGEVGHGVAAFSGSPFCQFTLPERNLCYQQISLWKLVSGAPASRRHGRKRPNHKENVAFDAKIFRKRGLAHRDFRPQPFARMSPDRRLRLTTVGAPRPCGRRHAEPCQSSLLRLQVTPAQCGEWAEIITAASSRLASLLEENRGKLGITSKTDVTQDVVSTKTRPLSCRHRGIKSKDLVKATLASWCKQRALSDFSKYIVQSDNTLSAVVSQPNCTSVVKCLQRRAVIHRGL